MLGYLKKSARIAGIVIAAAFIVSLTSGSSACGAGRQEAPEPQRNDGEINEMLGKIASLEEKNASLADENTSLEKENSRLENKNEYLEREITRNENEIGRLEREINSLAREIDRNSNTGTILNLILLIFNIVWAIINKFKFIETLKEKFKKNKNGETKQQTETEIKTKEGENLT